MTIRPARLLRRAGRRTTLGLALCLGGAFLTGWTSFAAGTPVPSTLSTVAHGLFGVGTVVLLPWKAVVVRRATRQTVVGWALAALLLLCLVSGVVQAYAGWFTLLGVSPIQVHVGSALLALPLLGVHLWRHGRRQGPRRRDLSRRVLLRAGALTAGTAAAYAVVGTTSALAGRTATGSHRLAAADVPATAWLLDAVPDDPPRSVRVQGRERPLADLPSRAVRARLDCTSGWYADGTWTGVPLADLVRPRPGDRSVVVTSTTGYTRRFPLADLPSLWLATGAVDVPFTAGTGAPARLVAPSRRGFWWVKWVASVDTDDRPSWWQPPFPLQ